MYHTGLDPRTMQPVFVPPSPHDKAMQRALMQWKRPEKRPLVLEALHRAHREDLIGYGKHCLVRPNAKHSGEGGERWEKPSGKETAGKGKRRASPAGKKSAASGGGKAQRERRSAPSAPARKALWAKPKSKAGAKPKGKRR